MNTAASRRTWTARRDQAIVAAVLMTVWSVAAAMLEDYWLPSPWTTASRLAADVADGAIVRHAGITLSEAVAGLIAGVAPAVMAALVLHRRPLATTVLEPFLMVSYGLPKVALAPVLILWFGVGAGSTIAVVALSAFFVVYVHAVAGLRAMDRRLATTVRILGAHGRDVFRYVAVPVATPYILAGVRAAAPYSIGGAVLTEWLSGNRGLGYLLQFSTVSFDTAGTLSALALIAAIVAAINAAANSLERRVIRLCRAR